MDCLAGNNDRRLTAGWLPTTSPAPELPLHRLLVSYYARHLSSTRLKRCYDLAPPRVQQALRAEIGFVLENTVRDSVVLELGCGYGRVVRELAPRVQAVVGIDTSRDSIRMACSETAHADNCRLSVMDAAYLGFANASFSSVVCIQNGLSAFSADQRATVREAVRVTRPGGKVFLSSYCDTFWDERLEWFRIQSDHGLIGEIDPVATRNGVIQCTDGFRATTLGQTEFSRLVDGLGREATFVVVDGSHLFCVLTV